MSDDDLSFFELLSVLDEYGDIKSPDFVAITLPLLETVSQLHQNNQIAFITSTDQLRYQNKTLALKSQPRNSIRGNTDLFKKSPANAAIEVTGSIREKTDLDSLQIEQDNLRLQTDNVDITQPVYLANYKCWDYECGHYDPVSDIFQLGQMLASLAYNLDFNDREKLELFISNRKRLYFFNRDLHPTIHSVIYEMTDLYREDRTKNLDEVITKLRNYREYNPENYIDLSLTEGFRNQDVSARNNWILSRLKNRLFDISRRNKLLYFSDRQSFLNLTISSVPLLLDHENIKENSLIFWNDNIRKKVVKKQKLTLNSFLEFKENRFLAPTINKIRLEARKSQNEFGFSQLRMVIAFMHWYNFKESAEERISSPLLLLPAEVIKNKGVEDRYSLEFSTTEAEINPILSHYLKDLYDLELPDFIDLETNSIEELISSIQSQISAGGTGIQLEWRQKPRIQLIHSIARKNFNLRNKKLANRSRGLNLKTFAYSYDSDSFNPLGLQIFNHRIRSHNNALEYIINEDLSPEHNQVVAEKSRSFYQTDNEGDINPLVWEIDSCNMTIGNFNYRKMSLVRDYDEIINSNIKDEVFEQLFSELPKKLALSQTAIELNDNYPIISSDPTQTSAIGLARSGESYIIQGPPGTGKSQTITNLIADYISRDKKILFVCEKRAALDVVYHRLKNKNLDELCCLVHDSQMDKKSFIQDLKQVYNDFQEYPLEPGPIEQERKAIVKGINTAMAELGHFHQSMTDGDTNPLELFTVLHATQLGKTAPSEIDCIHLPGYDDWKANREWIEEWIEQLQRNRFSGYIADYPLARLATDILAQSNPKATVHETIERCTGLLDSFIEFLDELDVTGLEQKDLNRWSTEFQLIPRVIGLCQADKLAVLDPDSDLAGEFQDAQKNIAKQQLELERQARKNRHWTHKLNPQDTEAAKAQWQSLQSSFFRFLNPAFYRLKKQILQNYDVSAHDIKPQISTLLSNLLQEHQIQAEIETLQQQLVMEFNLGDHADAASWVENIQQNPNEIINVWLEQDHGEYLRGLADRQHEFEQLIQQSALLFGELDELTLSSLDARLAESRAALNSLSVFLPLIKKARMQSPALQSCLFKKSWDSSDFCFHLAYKSLQDIYELNRQFHQADGDSLQISIMHINALLDQYYDSNVETIRARIRQKFLNMLRITESTAAQLSADEKILKKAYRGGRRILENEFGKSMRYKSIRELTAGEARDLMTTIKPVWLMSPLSVSDILPIDTSIFDVVIYDEASQITVEEGVPSLFRTHQTIVVGDEMQMPPTNFFSTSSAQDEDEEETENRIGISLDAESLLNQSSRKLASVMLGWHYRSRHENLISFSNSAFYQRSLLTIPDTVMQNPGIETLAPILDVSLEVEAEQILNRSISFHYLENAVYESRKNRDEADYIANIVRQLLAGESGKSIGVVAFSMDQQSEIEAALERLAATDPEFDSRLEEEYQRIDEDQFNGLFVKNLENVQGDERDIIIMSVCYGANAKGKMLMNFGPINRRGGEKRLNVIFSRAKQHMVIVSSILANEIKNDYNEGANYFKRFLAYAKHCSDGRDRDAELILDGMFSYEEDVAQVIRNPVIQQLAEALREKGYGVDLAVGSSHFKCDIAIKQAGGSHYSLGILVDKSSHYENLNILEQYCQKPEILKAFGWRIAMVYSKDWFEKPAGVIEKIELELAGKTQAPELNLESLINPGTDPAQQSDIELAAQSVNNAKPEIPPQPIDDLQPGAELSSTGEFERYEFTGGSSNKYWEISSSGNTLTVRYGRIGNKPQRNEKVFDSAERSSTEKQKLVATKLRKGYRRVDS